MKLSQLEREVKALQMMLRNVSGQGVSTNHGVLSIRPVQVGFAAELTSSYSSTTGYSWKQLRLDGNEVSAESTPLTGDKAFAIDGDESFGSGTLAWLEPDPTSTGYLIASLGGGSRGFWAEITSSSGTPVAYSWKRKAMTGPGVWADATEPTPLTGTADAYRAPSNVDPPVIPTGQVVELRPSRTSPGEYEIHAPGGIQTETFNIWRYTCDGSDLIETEYTVTIKGRDLDVSVA